LLLSSPAAAARKSAGVTNQGLLPPDDFPYAIANAIMQVAPLFGETVSILVTTNTLRCAICANTTGNVGFEAREMIFGMRDKFVYFECTTCGCVQIDEVPANLADYYPSAYFAFKPQHKLAKAHWRATLDHHRFRAALFGTSWLGSLANAIAKPLNYVEWARHSGVRQDARVLDIGCGAGKLLVRMKHAGFEQCVGVDPYIGETLNYANGATVRAQTLTEFARTNSNSFDFIMLHHALEHMPHQQTVLEHVKAMLSPNGRILIRIPVAACFAWRTYGADWVNLDPPRHLYLHTQQSLALLAEQVDLDIIKTVYDSTARQFVGSELWQRDIALEEPSPERKAIEAQKPVFELKANKLNAANDGDMAAFYLRHRN
jgi:2-polyprenyl-3-methyl-5-hydroxy-6-metoxy-1,4-benzoquinol methylase